MIFVGAGQLASPQGMVTLVVEPRPSTLRAGYIASSLALAIALASDPASEPATWPAG